MAWLINRHHLEADMFSVRDAMNLAVKPDDREACLAGWEHAKAYINANECFVQMVFPEVLGYLDGVTTPFGGHHMRLQMKYDEESAMAFIPPKYTHNVNNYASDADPALVERATSLCQKWMQTGADWGLVLQVVAWLNDTYKKDPDQVRFLLPGIVPLLKRTKDSDCLHMANKLAKAKPNFTYDPLPEDKRAALVKANETIAMGLLYSPRQAPVPDVNHCSLSLSYSSQIIHELWPEPFDPCLGT